MSRPSDADVAHHLGAVRRLLAALPLLAPPHQRALGQMVPYGAAGALPVTRLATLASRMSLDQVRGCDAAVVWRLLKSVRGTVWRRAAAAGGVRRRR